MERITKEIKAELKAAGQWEAFVSRRRDLRESGLSVGDALEQAIAYARAGGAVVKEQKKAVPVSEDALVSSSLFDGKVASRAEEFNWVVANLYVADAKAEDAPSAVSWTLLQMCRRNHDFAEDLIGRGLVKMLPSKIEEEDNRPGAFDGQTEYDLLNEIRGVNG